MSIGIEEYELTKREQKYLEGGIAVLIDSIIQDIEILFAGKPWIETMMLSKYLPKNYVHRYDVTLAKQFLDTVMAVAYKFQDQEAFWTLNSVAEQMAMYAILAEAEGYAETYNAKIDITKLTDLLFYDIDFELLFDPRFDGFEDDEEFKAAHGMENLSFKDWFKPFSSEFCRHKQIVEKE
jgi:hypothetical protein